MGINPVKARNAVTRARRMRETTCAGRGSLHETLPALGRFRRVERRLRVLPERMPPSRSAGSNFHRAKVSNRRNFREAMGIKTYD
jgi:hypothetical protein